jgi:hypothetical protein
MPSVLNANMRNGQRGHAQDISGMPQKTRKIQRNRESLDLDDVMAGSDDEVDAAAPPISGSNPPTPRKPNYKVSASTRELMDFLETGPPNDTPNLSRSGREMVDFLDQGPPESGGPTVFDARAGSKGSGGRGLARMISKLSIGGDKDRQRMEELSRTPSRRVQGVTGAPVGRGAGLSKQPSNSNISALANRPVPPRPPPMSASMSIPPDNEMQHSQSSPRDSGSPPAIPAKSESRTNGHQTNGINGMSDINGSNNVNGTNIVNGAGIVNEAFKHSAEIPVKRQPTKSLSSAAPRKISPPTASHVTADDARDLRRLANAATTVDECRLILDMFLAKAGIPIDIPSASVSSMQERFMSGKAEGVGEADHHLENVLELYLGGDFERQNAVSKVQSPPLDEAEATAKQPSIPLVVPVA